MDALVESLSHTPFWIALGQIIWINILLSGDNAVVIALACRSLPPRQKFWGILLGAGAAVLLRVIFTVVIAQVMLVPFLKLVGGLLLLWIAVKLLVPEEDHGQGEKVKAGETLMRAVWLVTVADIVMSLDNVIAIAAAAETAAARIDIAHAVTVKTMLIVFGLATSVPLIIAGSALLMAVLSRFPVLVWAGAALLGWVAGEIIVKDSAVVAYLGEAVVETLHLWAAAAGALIVVAVGYGIRQYKHKGMVEQPLVYDPPGPEEFPPHEKKARRRGHA